MRQAPAVRVECAADGPWRWLHAALYALASVALVLWLSWRFELALLLGATVALLVGCVAAAVAWWRTLSPACVLEWDGQSWRAALNAGPATGAMFELSRVDVMMDFASSLLLRLRSPQLPRGQHWVLLRRSDVGQTFDAMCIALYAQSPQAQAGQAGQAWQKPAA